MYTHLEIGHEGRLGNQLFQYAMIKSVAERNNSSILLPRENGLIETNVHFNPSINAYDKQKLELFNCFEIDTDMLEPKNYIQSKVKQTFREPPGAVRFYPEVFEQPENTNYCGYFQSYEYFRNISEKLLRDLAFKQNISNYGDKILLSFKEQQKNTIGIHIRRGDGLNQGIKGLYTTFQEFDYYHSIISEIDCKDNLYVIFSDEIQTCKKEFGIKENIIYFDNSEDTIPKQFIDLYVMSKMDKLILPASTFSWWAAILGNIPIENVYCPKRWWGPMLPGCSEQDIKIQGWNLR